MITLKADRDRINQKITGLQIKGLSQSRGKDLHYQGIETVQTRITGQKIDSARIDPMRTLVLVASQK